MNQTVQNFKSSVSHEVLQSILEELRLLREEVGFLLPQENLEGYANSERIRHSYQKAMKKYPPNYSWR